MAHIFNMVSGVGGSGATLTVNAPAGCTVTIIDENGKTKASKSANSQGVAIFKGLKTGTWTVTIIDGEDLSTDTVQVDADYSMEMSFRKIYGIYRNIASSSPQWTREDNAVGKTASASIGTIARHSDFDSCYPWSGIVRETLSTGDVMVKIPKFWYQRYRDGGVEHIKIADRAIEGFSLHPAFCHAGVEKDFLYVGAYETSGDNKSVSGAAPTVSQARSKARGNAKSKGDGWSLIDITAVSAIQMLILVEFANNNVQSVIGRGNCDSGSAINTGSCDSVPNLTGIPAGTDGQTGVVWRGLENFWGNVGSHVDGVNWNGGTYYVCNDPSKYADGTSTNYTALSYKGSTGWSSSFITEAGLDTGNNPHVLLASAAGSGSETTYLCDTAQSNTGWRVCYHGGDMNNGSGDGLFFQRFYHGATGTSPTIGHRLQYIPQ